MTAAALLSIALAAGCTSTAPAAQAPEQTHIVVADVPGEGSAGLYIAQQDGFFTRAGLHVTIDSDPSASTAIPAMLHGSVDIDLGEYPAYIATDANGVAKVRILAAAYALGPHVQEILTPAHSPVTSLAGLRGQVIAVNALNSVTTDLLDSALATYGLSPDQVRVVAMPFPAMPAALAAHRIAAAYEIEPFVTEAVHQDGAQELYDIDTGPSTGFPIAGYGALATWVAKNPRTVAAFITAVRKGNAIADTNLAAVQKALSVQLHLSSQITGVMAIGTFPTTLSSTQIQRIATIMLQYHQLDHPFSVKAILGA